MRGINKYFPGVKALDNTLNRWFTSSDMKVGKSPFRIYQHLLYQEKKGLAKSAGESGLMKIIKPGYNVRSWIITWLGRIPPACLSTATRVAIFDELISIHARARKCGFRV